MSESRTAIITGAARGIGAGIAKKFAADGFKVAVLDLAEGACQTVVDDAELEALGVRTIRAPLLDCSRGFARHDPKKLAAEIMRLYQEEAHTKIYG